MLFTFDDVKVDQSNGVWLCLHVEERAQAVGFMMNRKPKPYTADIKEQRNQRSLDANAYYWRLCGLLAKELGESPDNIYLQHIRDIGNYEVICVQTQALEDFERKWKSNHLGRFIETRQSKIPGCVTVLAYYGSSDFNTREMSILIDNCIQDCKAVGIETLPPDKIALIKEAWNDGQVS